MELEQSDVGPAGPRKTVRVMVTFKSGEEISLEEPVKWNLVTVNKGDVVEVNMAFSNWEPKAGGYAAFIVLQAITEEDRSVRLLVRFLGAEELSLSQSLKEKFGEEGGFLHLCLTKPCVELARPELFTLHVTRVKLWKWDDFKDADYLSQEMVGKLPEWLAAAEPPLEKEPKKKPPRRRTTPTAPTGNGRGKGVPPGKDSLRKNKTEASRGAKASRGRAWGYGRRNEKEATSKIEGCQRESGRCQGRRGDCAWRCRRGFGQWIGNRQFRLCSGRIGPEYGKWTYTTPSDYGFGVEEEGEEKEEEKKHLKRPADRGSVGGRYKRFYFEELEWSAGSPSRAGSTGSGCKKEKGKGLGKEERCSREVDGGLDSVDFERRRRRLRRQGQEEQERQEKEKEEEKEKTSDPEGWSDRELQRELKYIFGLRGGEGEFVGRGFRDANTQEEPDPCKGSILAMLTNHVREQLEQTAMVDLNAMETTVTGGVKILTYFTLQVKPAFGTHYKELRELHHLAMTMDTLRKGDIARTGDALAARFMAIHQSLIDQNWSAARHLELYPMEEASAASSGVILATRKHSRLVAKMQGFVPNGNWGGYGRGRGKGGKGGKGEWQVYGDSKGDPKGKKGGKKGDGKGKGKGASTWNSGKDDANKWKDTKEKEAEK